MTTIRLLTVLHPLVLCSVVVTGQDRRFDSIDDILPVSDMDEELVEQLQWILDHPFDLNQVSAGQLAFIPGVSSVDAARIVGYRKSHGPFQSADQIAVIDGLSEHLAETLRPFVTVAEYEPDRQALSIEVRARLVRDLQLRRGFSEGLYHGSPEKIYIRTVAATAGGFSGSVLLEKDAGEPESLGFLSGNASYDDPLHRFNFVAGDFRIETGQGLVLWNGGGLRGNDPSALAYRKGRGIVPHRSADEVGFFRGVAAGASVGFEGGTIRILGFVSRRSLTGTADSTGTVGSLDESGLYRTTGELEKRGAFREDMIGADLGFSAGSGFSTGITTYRSRFVHALSGKTETRVLAGAHAAFRVGTIETFAEAATSGSGAGAVILGSAIRPGRSVLVSLSYRCYSPQFLNSHASAFGVRSDSRNEAGFQLGLMVRPLTGLTWTIGLDRVSFPSATGSASVAASGVEFMSQFDIRFNQKSSITLRYQNGLKEVNGTLFDLHGRDRRFMSDERDHRARITLSHTIGHLRFRTRIEGVHIPAALQVDAETGMIVFQDCRLRLPVGVSVEGRIIFFQTDSFRSRIYEFENDVRGSFSVPALFGTGVRWYLLVQYEPFARLRFSVRYSETVKEGVRELGSGLGTIQGDTENEMAIQLDLAM